MSYYYNYYIGYEQNGKIYPLGPYNHAGKLCCALSRSKSFASDLHYSLYPVKEEQISDALRKEFTEKDWNGNECVNVRYMKLSDLPSGSYIKRGYFLIEDVKQYEDESRDYDFDGFYDCLDPITYSAKLQNEMMFGKPPAEKDECGESYQPHSASDYMFYAYPDYQTKEYEAFVLSCVADMLYPYELIHAGASIVILETEG